MYGVMYSAKTDYLKKWLQWSSEQHCHGLYTILGHWCWIKGITVHGPEENSGEVKVNTRLLLPVYSITLFCGLGSHCHTRFSHLDYESHSILKNQILSTSECAAHLWPANTTHGVTLRFTQARWLSRKLYCGEPSVKLCSVLMSTKWILP